MKIKISSLISIVFIHTIVIKLQCFKNYQTFSILLSVMLLLILITKIKVFDKKYIKIHILLLFFLITLLISAINNKSNIMLGVSYAIKVADIYLYWEYISNNRLQKTTMKKILIILGIYIIFNDILAIAKPNLFTPTNSILPVYLLGTKFTVAYLHLLFYSIYSSYMWNEKSFLNVKVTKIILLSITLIISIITECSTAIIGIIVMIVMEKIIINKRKAINAFIFILTLLLSFLIIYQIGFLLQSKPVQYVIINVLHEDLTLTGRMNIYNEISNILLEHKWLGYGYGKSYDIIMSRIGYADSQNALMECIINYGIVGTGVLLLIFYFSIKLSNGNERKLYIMIYLYAMVVMGVVEITINLLFMFAVSMMIDESNKIGVK